MRFYPRAAIVVWLLLLAASGWLVAGHTRITTDLTAFLPPSASRNQQLLMDQLRDGVASRLMLIAIEGNDPERVAATSRQLARGLKVSGLFGYVNNGEAAFSAAEREVLMRWRYLLSPAVTAEHFGAPALREALENNLQMLGSPAGAMLKATLPADPTGELWRILATLSAGASPPSNYGVWFSPDGKRALLVAETVAPGFDVDRQQLAMDAARRAFAAASPPGESRLLLSGPGVFAAESRAAIEKDSWRLTVIATGLVMAILLAVYRSGGVVLLSLLPVASGLLLGIAAVGLAFGSVHGITLGFGATLIGEAVDYPSYLFTHAAPGETVRNTLRRIWPTLRLAVLTTVFGGLTMLLSSFTGLAQLGLLSMTGVLVAGLVTRWVLPALAGNRIVARTKPAVPVSWLWRIRSLPGAAWAVGLLLAAAIALIAARHDRLWDDDLANMSPVPESAKALDKELRAQIGAPDVRYLLAATGADREAALERSEGAAAWLRGLAGKGVISGYELAASYLPSQQTQERRRAALPDEAALQGALGQAARGLPFRDGLFAPFLRDVGQAKNGKLLEPDDLKGSALELKVRSLLFRSGGEWVALAPLRGVGDEARLAAAAARLNLPGVFLLDLKAESNRLVNGYRNESLRLTALGLAAIALVLLWGLRGASAAWRILFPVLAAQCMAIALLLLLGERLSLFHLVSLLLVVGIGLNYALFFNRPQPAGPERERTALSLTVCSLTTLSAFGALTFSQVPVLHAIGLTVTLGGALSLLVSAALAKAPEAEGGALV